MDRIDSVLLGLLPLPQREAIVLAFYGDHTYRDVARLLGRPEGIVNTQIRTGLRRLRSKLTDLDHRRTNRPDDERTHATSTLPLAR